MRRSLLVYVPITAFVATLAVGVFAPPDVRWPVVDAAIRGLKVAALFGCLVAALSFPPRSHMFRTWSLFAGAYGLLVLRDAVLHRSLLLDVNAAVTRWIEMVVVTAANLLGALGAWAMARTWSVSGLALPGTATARATFRAITIGVAFAITLPTLWLEGSALLTHVAPRPLMGLANALGDTAAISMVAPVLLTALALGGEPVGKVWTLLTWSLVAWLCYDATAAISGRVPAYGEQMRALSEAFRAMAAAGAAAAGIAQALLAVADDADATRR